MNIRIYATAVCAAVVLAAAAAAAVADEQHSMSMNHEAMHPVATQDTRELVHFPAPLIEHEMANMRDHLITLSRIQEYLSKKEFDKAGELAEKRLGMSSFGLHGAHEVAPYMPKGMQDAGTAMHRNASRFAIELQKTAVSGDLKPALAALARTTEACVACHASYRLE